MDWCVGLWSIFLVSLSLIWHVPFTILCSVLTLPHCLHWKRYHTRRKNWRRNIICSCLMEWLLNITRIQNTVCQEICIYNHKRQQIYVPSFTLPIWLIPMDKLSFNYILHIENSSNKTMNNSNVSTKEKHFTNEKSMPLIWAMS